MYSRPVSHCLTLFDSKLWSRASIRYILEAGTVRMHGLYTFSKFSPSESPCSCWNSSLCLKERNRFRHFRTEKGERCSALKHQREREPSAGGGGRRFLFLVTYSQFQQLVPISFIKYSWEWIIIQSNVWQIFAFDPEVNAMFTKLHWRRLQIC